MSSGAVRANEVPAATKRILGYVPTRAPHVVQLWPVVAPFVVRIVLLISPPTSHSAEQSMYAVSRLAAWGVRRGLVLDEEVLFEPSRIEEFIATAEGMSDDFRLDLRSRLRAIGPVVTRNAPWPPVPKRGPRRLIAAPYSAVEEDLLEHDIGHQRPTVWRSAQATHHLGLGVGLRPSGVRAVTAEHVVEVRGTWCVAVQLNGTVQYVPIRLAHVAAILDLAERFPDGPLVHERAATKELGSMLTYFQAGNSTPWPLAYRYRSTWMLAHLAAGVRVDVIGRAAGVRSPRHILDLLPYLPAVEPDEEMRWLSGDDE